MGILDLYKISGEIEDYMKNKEVEKALSERIEKLREIHLIKDRT